MNIILTYYLLYFISGWVLIKMLGSRLYKSGAVFIKAYIEDDTGLALLMNRFLLIGFYLVNIGYLLISISFQQVPASWFELIRVYAKSIGLLALLLTALHQFNIWMIATNYNKLKSLFSHFNH